MPEPINTDTHSGFRAPDATRQGQYDQLAKADSLEAIAASEVGQEAMQSPVFQKFLKARQSLGK